MKKLLLLTVAIFVTVSCSSVDKKHFKARSFYEKNRKELANLCNSEFPSETKYIKGDPIIKIDTTYTDVPYQINCDSVVNSNKVTEKKNIVNGKLKLPHIKEKESKTDTIVKPNTAYEDKLRYKINDLESDNTLLIKEKESLKNDLKQAEKEKAKKDWIIFSLGFLCVIGIVVIIKK